MLKKLFLIFLCFVGYGLLTVNTSDAIETYWYPTVRLFGNNTVWKDSTNYTTFSKSVYVLDSFKVKRDIYLGTEGGTLYLDTSRGGYLRYSGLNMELTNNKTAGDMVLTSSLGVKLIANTPGKIFLQSYGDIELQNANSNKTKWYNDDGDSIVIDATGHLNIYNDQQLRLGGDTVSDYDANNSVTLNRQSGVITTASLTTAPDNFYTLTFVNSLISATSKVFVQMTAGGTESGGRPTVYTVTSGSGSASIVLLNLAGAGSYNGTVKLNFLVMNNAQ